MSSEDSVISDQSPSLSNLKNGPNEIFDYTKDNKLNSGLEIKN